MKTTLHRPVIHASGLTLLELLVVLSILAVLSTVALTSSSGLADQARYEATQRTLENIREAVLGPANLRDTDGTLLYTGFVADTGRLPRAVLDGADFTLAELWENVNALAPHAVRQAIAANVDVAAEADSDVYLATGWRGPYLRLTPGNLNIRDGWGGQFILRTQVPADVAAAGDPIGQVHSFGANGTEDALDDGYDLDVSSEFTTAETAASTTITVELQKADGSPPDMPVPADEIIVRLFAPDPDTGLIAVTRLDDPFSANSLMFDFTTTPGARVVRAYYDTSNDGSIQSSSAVTHLNLRHGGNTRTIILTVP
ncbi:prepilin-type N-terminal cleavage/methylation domain-containing protein [Prosthecobacter sp.]|jgi:prepilin-type N-terminal cleavage/methylation domain-containing protein